MELANYLWVEKYRPTTIDEVVLPEKYRRNFKNFIEEKQIPTMIFAGPPGSGKTTCARILTSPQGILSDPENNLLLINGSAKSTRGIAFVDEVVKPFLRLPPVGDDKIRVVFIDEADNLTQDAFKQLRALSESYSQTARFLFTCNYFSNIPDPIKSRMTNYTFQRIPKDFVESYCDKILTNEKIQYKREDLLQLINMLYPDIRKIVNSMQDYSIGGKLEVDFSIVVINEKKVVTLIVELLACFDTDQNKRIDNIVSQISKIITNNEIDYYTVYTELFEGLNKASVKVIVNKYCNGHKSCLVPHMHFMAMVFEIIQTLHYYRSMLRKATEK